ncbi:hypothetical protein [Akkermansia glycaniphila]|uniref:Armadillo-type fold n=1 Tax=Akkermansia glycaniphila TaxID=1679444 RepID=A0A1H6KY46_9BACT|nr:hypothetical protein [Akkermansia glycaniphila]SEH77908.1 armadillo-type fold [Akkermansia glycaniphila]
MTDDTSPEDKKTTIPAGAPIKKVDPNELAARAAAKKAEARPIARRVLVAGGGEIGERPKLFSQADEVEIQKPRFVTPILKEQLEKEAAEAAARAEEEAARAAEEEARRAEEEARLAAEAAARAEAEAAEEARRLAEEQARAEEEARLAQEEYERQMREYEEQLAAYERQQAEEARLAAEQAAAQQAEAARLAAEQAAAHTAAQQAAAAAQPQAAAPTPAPMPVADAAGAPLAANLQATLDQIRAMQEALAAQAQAMAMVAQQAGLAAPAAHPYAAPAFAPAPLAGGTPLPAAPPAPAPAAAPVKLGAPKLSLSALKGTAAPHHDPAAQPAAPATPASPFAGAPAPALARPSLAAQPHTPAASPFASAPAPMLAPHAAAAPETAPSEPAAQAAPKLSLNASPAAAPSLATPKLARPGLALQSSASAAAAPGTQTAEDPENPDAAATEAAEQARQDAYYQALQSAAAQTPWHKKKSVLFMLGGFAALFIGVGIALYFKMQDDKAQQEEDKKIQALLKVAEGINKSLIKEPKGDLSLEALQQKNVGLGSINKDSCQRLLRVIKNKDRDIGVARQAIIYLAVMMAQDASLCQLVIDDIVKKPEAYDKDRFDWLTQNIAATRMPNAKQLLLDLAEKINTKAPDNKDMYIGEIYKNIAGLVDAGDFDAMVKLVNDEKTSGKLAGALANNLYTIIESTYRENPEAAAALGDKLVSDINEKKMAGQLLLALAQAGSPKGFEMIKNRMANAPDPRMAYGVWTNVKQALSMWSNDSVVPYLVELRTAENPMIAKEADTALAALINHDSSRTDEEFDRLVALVYGDLNTDTSEYDELNNKLSPGSAMEVKSSDPSYAGLQARMEKIKPIHNQKIIFCTSLAKHTAKPHIMRYLEKMSKDSDRLVAVEAKSAMTRVQENTKKAEAAKAAAAAKKD